MIHGWNVDAGTIETFMTESNDVNEGLSQKMYSKSTQCQLVSNFFLPHLCPLLPYHELHLLFERALAMQPNRSVYHSAYYNVLWCIRTLEKRCLCPLFFSWLKQLRKNERQTRDPPAIRVAGWLLTCESGTLRREPGERRLQMDQCLFSIWLMANFFSCASNSAATVPHGPPVLGQYRLLARTPHEEMFPNHLLMHETSWNKPFFSQTRHAIAWCSP